MNNNRSWQNDADPTRSVSGSTALQKGLIYADFMANWSGRALSIGSMRFRICEGLVNALNFTNEHLLRILEYQGLS